MQVLQIIQARNLLKDTTRSAKEESRRGEREQYHISRQWNEEYNAVNNSICKLLKYRQFFHTTCY